MSDISIHRQGRVKIIRFDRAEKKNAITRSMYAQLATAIVDADKDDTIGASLFLGQPGVFTSGNDIADFMAVANGAQKGTEVVDFLRAVIGGTKPLVAGVDGLAVGIGCTMLMHCDLVYASPGAWMQTPFTDLGLVPEAASSFVAPRIMGPQRAFALLGLGERMDAVAAHRAGLVNEVVDAALLEAKALESATRLAEKPAEALAISRRLLRGDREEILARLEEESRLFAERLRSDEARVAFAAFMARKSA